MVHAAEYKQKALERKMRFQNQKKKNNIFKTRRDNNFKKKRFYPYPNNPPKTDYQKPQTDSTTLRKRGFYKILPVDDISKIPKCEHGPCLLFEKKDDGKPDEVYFACAVYRNKSELCDYRRNFDKETREIEPEKKEEENDENLKKKKKKKTLFGYNQIPKNLAAMSPEDNVLYCEQCINVYANRHACVCAPIEREKLAFPTTILPPLDEQNGESQFFFSQESLDVIVGTIENSKVDGVLCIGAPRIFETVRARYPDKNVFMLDYDKRFAKFYPSKQFAQYSMLVDHFYDKNSEEKLKEFFEKSTSIVLVVDPPFGVFMEPLLKSIEKMKARFENTGKSTKSFYSMIILPIFIRKYVLHDDFWMSDYRVTYSNHKLYGYPEKTIVRIFTNVPKECMDLSKVSGYKYCSKCEKWVTDANEHCEQCDYCTSIETGKFRHCDQCSKCVKPTYIHCRTCEKCHLYKRCI